MDDRKRKNQQKVFDSLAKRFSSKIKDSVSQDEEQALGEFLTSAFGANTLQTSQAYNSWLYNLEIPNKRFIAWDQDQVTACQAQLACDLVTPAQEQFQAAWAIDLSVREDWRMKGLGVAMIKQVMDQHTLSMGLGISDSAQAMFDRLGWKKMPPVNCFLKPLNAKGFSNLEQESLKAKLIFPIAGWVFRTFTQLKLLFNKQTTTVKTISNLAGSEQALNDLFKNDSVRINAFHSGKSTEFLKWRFQQAPSDKTQYKLSGLYEAETLVGYMVTKVAHWKGKKILAIIDYYCNSEHYCDVIAECEKEALINKVDAIMYHGIDANFDRTLKQNFFIKRPHGDAFMLYCSQADLIEKGIFEADNWHITFADSDMDYMFL